MLGWAMAAALTASMAVFTVVATLVALPSPGNTPPAYVAAVLARETDGVTALVILRDRRGGSTAADGHLRLRVAQVVNGVERLLWELEQPVRRPDFDVIPARGNGLRHPTAVYRLHVPRSAMRAPPDEDAPARLQVTFTPVGGAPILWEGESRL